MSTMVWPPTTGQAVASTAPQQEQEKEEVIVSGVVNGVEAQANGQFIVKVKQNPDDQYDAKLRTKDANLAQSLMGHAGQYMHFKCGLSHYTYNNQPVTSKWINEVALGDPARSTGADEAGLTMQPAPGPTLATPAPAPQDNRQLVITWLAVAKGMPVECFKRLPTEQQTLESAVAIIDHFTLLALNRGEQGLPALMATPQPPAASPSDVYTGFQDGDDIPF